MTDWHDTLRRWAKAPSETEEEKAARVARMVREALSADAQIGRQRFQVIVVGSYRNNTNLRSASDIDLAAVLTSAQYSEYPPSGVPNREVLGLADAEYGLATFRAEVESALRRKFGGSDVRPGRIAITVDDNSGRLNADVTPYVIHRRYTGARDSSGAWVAHDGIETRPLADPNRRLIQWPEQHYARGVAKNNATNRRYKRIVRILKHARDHIIETGHTDAQAAVSRVPSCLIEHAVFNAPNTCFNLDGGTYYLDTKAVVAHVWRAMQTANAHAFIEVSGMDQLFRTGEPWTPKVVQDFMLAVWQHVGFKDI